jgi:hypothetical protein
MVGCLAAALIVTSGLTPAAKAADSFTDFPVRLNVNYGETTEETFYQADGQVFADIRLMARLTRCAVSRQGDDYVLKHAGAIRTVTFNPNNQTIDESLNSGGTSRTQSLRILRADETVLVPAYSTLTYLGATVEFDPATGTVEVDMPRVTFWEAFEFLLVSDGWQVYEMGDHKLELILDNIIDFINPGGSSIFDLISGARQKDAIYAALDADPLAYDSARTKAAENLDSMNAMIEQIKAANTAGQNAVDLAFLLDDARFLRIVRNRMGDQAERVLAYIDYFDQAEFRSRVSEIANGAADAADAVLLAADIATTIYDRVNASATAKEALKSTLSRDTLQRAGNPPLNGDYVRRANEVSATLSSVGVTMIRTALEKSASFFADKASDAAIKALSSGSAGMIAYELSGLVQDAVLVSPIGKYTPFAEVPKAEASRMGILASEYAAQTLDVLNGLRDRVIQDQGRDQQTLNAFYYSTVLLLRYSLVWHESWAEYNRWVKGGDTRIKWFQDGANTVAGTIFDFETCSVTAIPDLADLADRAADFDAEVVQSAPEVVSEADFFASLPETFTFSSGAGAWRTIVRIHGDGAFDGEYSDSNAGDIGLSHPNGTRYECHFSGRFGDVKRISDFEYSMRLEGLTQVEAVGSEKIVDEVLVVGANPYGFEDADEFRVYLPGRTTSDLPEAFLSWVGSPWAWADVPTQLPFHGLYNLGGEQGFTGSS